MAPVPGPDQLWRRAERVLTLLQGLWGDDMPPAGHGRDPRITVLLDALAGDDDLGGRDGYVVQGDGLTHAALAQLLRATGTAGGGGLELPRDLLSRVFSTGDATTDRGTPPRDRPRRGETPSAPVSTGSPLPVVGDPRSAVPADAGSWILDADSGTLSWDADCARVLRRERAPQSISLTEELTRWVHPHDRQRVAEGFDRCSRTAQPHEVQFRSLQTAGGYVTCLASGRRVVDVTGRVVIVGLLRAAGSEQPA